MRLEDDKYCFVCGNKNKYGLKLKFRLDDENILHTEFIPEKHHQGFKNIVHGGIIGLILDEVMVNAARKIKNEVVTAEFKVKLKKPAKIDKKIHFRGWIDKEKRNIIYASGDAKDEKGNLIATASSKCFKV